MKYTKTGILLGLILIISIIAYSCGEQDTAAPVVQVPKTESADLVRPSENTAPRPHPLSIPGLRDRIYSAEDFTLMDYVDAADGLVAREFSYGSEGYRNYGLIEMPAGDPPEGGWPVIVLAHGYIPPNTYSTTENYRLVTRYYAAGGFLVVKPDYRGHGRSASGGQTPSRTIDYSVDVLNLLAGLNKIPEADVDNVFLYGHSMGGEIGLRILTVNKSLKAASLWAAVTQDFPENTQYFIRRRSTEEAENLQRLIDAEFSPEQYESLSPNYYLESISVPVLIHHGTADESVPFDWSYSFRERLDAAEVDYEFIEYPGENHNISRSFYRALDRDMEFFRSLM